MTWIFALLLCFSVKAQNPDSMISPRFGQDREHKNQYDIDDSIDTKKFVEKIGAGPGPITYKIFNTQTDLASEIEKETFEEYINGNPDKIEVLQNTVVLLDKAELVLYEGFEMLPPPDNSDDEKYGILPTVPKWIINLNALKGFDTYETPEFQVELINQFGEIFKKEKFTDSIVIVVEFSHAADFYVRVTNPGVVNFAHLFLGRYHLDLLAN